MVQVDVFWSYGIGAGFAVAAADRIAAKKSEEGDEPMADRGFLRALLFLALVFAPSGLYLLWEFTSWETMHALNRDMPAWLVALFGLTNVSQGLLGYFVTRRLLRTGQWKWAKVQPVIGYFLMFFVLVYGWDGTGYQRFFSPSVASLHGWSWHTALDWMSSDVAITLYAMGAIMIPLLFWMSFFQESKNPWSRSLRFLWLAVPVSLGLAIGCSLLLWSLSLPGGILALGLLAILGFSKWGPVQRTRLWASGAEG